MEALEAYFQDFCNKCGHSSHQTEQCRLYPEEEAVFTLCQTCLQGLHETCRSKRKDLVKARKQTAALQNPNQFTQKQLVTMYGNMFENNGQHYPFTTPCPPAVQYRVGNSGYGSESD
jgi:hypothetical protein